MRLVVKEVLVNDDTIVIRHCIPVPSGPPPTNDGGPNNDTDNAADPRSYLLRSGSMRPALRRSLGGRADQPAVEHARGQETADEPEQAFVGHPLGHQPHQDVVIDPVEGTPDTLPIPKTFPTSPPSPVRPIPSKVNVSRS